MSELVVAPSEVRPDLDEVPETDEPIAAHIVKVAPGESAAAKVLEALCGHVWVPSRDPKQLPLCEACKQIYEVYRLFNDGLSGTPNE